ncbi:outer membrane protein assembly factor BamA [Enterobacteriaceae endosymbiont of Donacia tomentosa]|uniref:outer membrane protein assembly factor BamA n=1 Tax=Enterobacteriaceae endosymbiont of Donacia tomentosa TaxID=2675787 RepID=UPI001449CC12|nr:outer membrane protein assembly factor BamA [Enterobacteriaceae endosymbiont of Donacia tomentosa]QJC31663.1 outer membrane protein assembly factor BamA [Enterobacteriaceae endosymbiont of Donacia tomentosa]
MIFYDYNKNFFYKIYKYSKYFLFIFLLIFIKDVNCQNIILKKQKSTICVQKIIFFGLNKLKLNDVLAKTPIKIGECISDTDLTKIIHILFITGFFEDINIFKHKNTIIIKVVEKPMISNISIKNNTTIKTSIIKEFLKNIGIKNKAILDRQLLFTFKNNIERIFYENGMFYSNIKIKIVINKNRTVNITIFFNEKNATKVKQINILGNHFYSTDFLIKYLNINNNFLFFFPKRDKYNFTYLNEKISKLQELYLDHGFPKFKIQHITQNLSYDKKNMFLTIKIKENQQFRIAKIILNINKNKYLKHIKNMVNISPGELYQEKKIVQLKDDIISYLGNYGFLNPNIKIFKDFNIKNHILTLILQIDVNKKYYVRKIEFSGNISTKNSILRRVTYQKEGAWFNSKLIEKTRRKLLSLGYFTKVEVLLHKNHDIFHTLDVIFQVQEEDTGDFSFNGGVGGWVETVSLQNVIKQENFLGTDNDIFINSNINNFHSYVEFLFNKNNVYFKDLSIGIKISLDNTRDNTNNSNYYNNFMNHNKGFGAVIKYPITENILLESNVGFSKNYITNINNELTLLHFLKKIGYKVYSYPKKNFILNELSISYSLLYNNLDNQKFPIFGQVGFLEAYFSFPWYDRTSNYKINFDYTHYIPLSFKRKKEDLKNNDVFIYLFKANIGYGHGFLGGTFPVYNNFYLGGINSIRGYKPNSIGPKAMYLNTKYNNCDNNRSICMSNNAIGGNFVININQELIIPMNFLSEKYKEKIRSSIFFDIGNLFNTLVEDNYLYKLYKIPGLKILSDIRSSLGISVKWKSSIGKFEISYAHPFKKYETDQVEQLQFHIGKTW